jgi:regulator of protease activity HflC (stomatin/prohibitin superfamily)
VTGLSEILQKLADYVGQLWPMTVVAPWETGVRVRLGKRMKVLEPGLHFVIPFVDVVYTSETNTELFTASKQTIDGVTFEVIGAFRLVDVVKFYTGLNDDPVTSVAYVVSAAASEAMSSGAWKGATEQMLKAVLRTARRRAGRWGIRIEWLEFRTVTDSPTLRLLTDATPPTIVSAGGSS